MVQILSLFFLALVVLSTASGKSIKKNDIVSKYQVANEGLDLASDLINDFEINLLDEVESIVQLELEKIEADSDVKEILDEEEKDESGYEEEDKEFSSGEPTIRENVLIFDAAASVSFEPTNVTITADQPYAGISIGHNVLTIKAGRQASKQPAQVFMDKLSRFRVLASGKGYFSYQPKHLNFALRGDLILEINDKIYKCENFHIGQGHHSTNNNWWIGSESCFGYFGSNIRCTCKTDFIPKHFWQKFQKWGTTAKVEFLRNDGDDTRFLVTVPW